MNSSNLALFWDLASLDANVRLKAGNALIQNLKEGQGANCPIMTEEDIAKSCSEDVAYAFKRLIRGLASARDDARLGFSMTFSEVP